MIIFIRKLSKFDYLPLGAYMIKKFLKWLSFIFALFVVLTTAILATAYWNRDKLLDKLTAEINSRINGKFSIGKIDFTFLHNFPNFSVTLKDVHLQDNLYDKYKREILSARNIFVDIAFYPLLKREVVINSIALDDANIFIGMRGGIVKIDLTTKSFKFYKNSD